MQWGVCIEILVETILRLESTVQGLSPVVRTTISSTQPLFTVSRLLHGVRVVQQVVIGVKMVVVAMGLLLLRVVFALATRGIRWTRVLSVRRRMIRCGRLLVMGGTAGNLLLGLAVLVATVGFGRSICTTKKI